MSFSTVLARYAQKVPSIKVILYSGGSGFEPHALGVPFESCIPRDDYELFIIDHVKYQGIERVFSVLSEVKRVIARDASSSWVGKLIRGFHLDS